VLHDTVIHASPAADVSGPWYSLDFRFVVARGDAALPKPPITGKAEGPRPQLDVLTRRR
jgi:catechol 1,2-dioxygenase